jgi:cytidylate kinase
MRDRIDTSRVNDPLRQAEDALVLDNTHLTLEEQFEFALAHATRLLNEKKTADIIDPVEQ